MFEAIRFLGLRRYIWLTFFYCHVMRLAHKYHWHHAPPCYPDGDTMLWCDWCGLRYIVPRKTGGIHAE